MIAFVFFLGYPDFIRDPNLLDERYKILEVRNDTYFQNNINLYIYQLKTNLEKINEPVNKTTWSKLMVIVKNEKLRFFLGMPPSAVNAYYTPNKNQMVFPAGIFQSPFYDSKYPDSLNYGAMGVVVGHELTHGFDDQGREFDKDGNLYKWWNNKTIDRFKQRTNCFAKQYSKFHGISLMTHLQCFCLGKYQVNGKNLNGNRTLGENIADNGGLKAAYHAYLELERSEIIPPLLLPGLNLTHRQLFFVAFAQIWCSTTTKEAVNLRIEKEDHSPAKHRVIGTLTNVKEFSDEFKCKVDSKMNPKDKCEVW